MSDAEILRAVQGLNADDLQAAWEYAAETRMKLTMPFRKMRKAKRDSWSHSECFFMPMKIFHFRIEALRETGA